MFYYDKLKTDLLSDTKQKSLDLQRASCFIVIKLRTLPFVRSKQLVTLKYSISCLFLSKQLDGNYAPKLF